MLVIKNELAQFAEFFEELPQPVIWLKPVYQEDGSTIKDFCYFYCNKKGLSYLKLTGDMLGVITVFNTPSLPDELRQPMFDEMLEVFNTGITTEKLVRNTVLNTFGTVIRSKFRDGILNFIQDSTREHNMIQQLELQARELEAQQIFSSSILDGSIYGILAMEVVYGSAGEIEDLQMVKVNRAFTTIVNKSAALVEGKSYLETFPHARKIGTFELYRDVILTGQECKKEIYYEGDGLNAWYDVTAVKWGANGVVVTFSDITRRKQSELELDERNRLVQTMLNASFHGKALLTPVYSNEGEIIDFTIVAANSSTEKQISKRPQDVTGKRMGTVLPGYYGSGGFENFKNAYEKNEPARYENFYNDNSFEGWFDIYVAPVPNGIVVSFANITERKKEALLLQQQTNLLDGIMANSPSGISVSEVIRDENGTVVNGKTILANEAAIRFVGIPKEDYLHKTALELDPEIMKSHVYEMSVHTLKTGEPFHTQYYLAPYDRWLELSVARLNNDRLINVFTDITTTKQVQLQVERFAEKLQKFINTSKSAMSLFTPVLDDNQKIIDFYFGITNTAWTKYTGQLPEALVGRPVSEALPNFLGNGLFEQCRTTFEDGCTINNDIRYKNEDSDLWLNFMSTRMDEGVLVTVSDFTNVKRLQLQLEKTVEDLRRSNASLQDFAYSASHDLQEPLRKIQFYSNKLKERVEAAQVPGVNDVANRIENSIVRMRQLIDDLLAYSRITDRDKMATSVDLNEIISNVQLDLESMVAEKGARLQTEKLPIVVADKSQLRQVFQNLVENALKYSKETEPPVISIAHRIALGNTIDGVPLSPLKKYYIIAVQDNGIGFDQRYAKDVFKIFQRLHSRQEYPGNGVGLAMVQKAVENHRGKIWVESEEGVGSTFFVALPVEDGY